MQIGNLNYSRCEGDTSQCPGEKACKACCTLEPLSKLVQIAIGSNSRCRFCCITDLRDDFADLTFSNTRYEFRDFNSLVDLFTNVMYVF